MIYRKRRPPIGSVPGTLAKIEGGLAPRIRAFRYSAESFEEKEFTKTEEIKAFLPEGKQILWVDVQGLGDGRVLLELDGIFGFHPLALADVVNIPQQPKAEVYDEHLFLVARMARFDENDCYINEQVSIFLKENLVVTFQETYGDPLDNVRARIRTAGTPMRKLGADFLAYAILDALLDGHYPVLESFGESLEDLEERMIEHPRSSDIHEMHEIKREFLWLRRNLWPQREAVSSLVRDENRFIKKATRVYIRDCYDHCVQLIDILENYRELTSDLMELYHTSLSNRLNEVMKILTIISTIFIPLSFITGIYGMNFKHMPEIEHPWAYPAIWGVILTAAGGMLYYFRRKGWLGNGDGPDDDKAP